MSATLRLLDSFSSGPAQVGSMLPRGQFFSGSICPVVNGSPVEDADVQVVSTWSDGSAALVRVTFPESTTIIDGVKLSFLPRAVANPELVFDPRSKRTEMLYRYACKVVIVDAGNTQWIAEVPKEQSWQVLQALIGANDQGNARRTIEFTLAPRAISDHPQLRVRFRWVAFSGWLGARCQVTVENCLVDAGRPTQDLSITRVDVYLDSESTPRYSRAGHTLEHGTRWSWSGWSGQPAPRWVAAPDGRDAEEIGLCPPYDWSSPATVSDGNQMTNSLLKATTAGGAKGPYRGRRGPAASTMETLMGVPGECWPMWGSQGDTGDRDDIGWTPSWTAGVLNGAELGMIHLQLQEDCNGSAAFNVHFRNGDEEPLGLPFTHPFWAKNAIPRKGTWTPNVAHHVTTGLWSLIMTGDEIYYDELRAWACLCVRDNYPNNGRLQNMGDRREAWALRTIAACMVVAPDDDSAKGYMQTCLLESAEAWANQLPAISAACPLGQLNDGDWKPGGRDQFAFTFVGSPWMGAWFLSTAEAVDRLLGGDYFLPIVTQGWKYFEMYANQQGGPANFDYDMLVDYSVPTKWYTPKIDAAGNWGVASEGPAFTDVQSFAAACRVAFLAHKKKLTAADMPPNPDPLAQPYDPAFPYTGSKFHEYGPGRCGTLIMAKKRGLPRADEAMANAAPLITAAENASKREHFARTRE